MKDELIDNLNAKIERNQKISAAVFGLLGISKLLKLIARFKYPELPDYTSARPIKNFLRSFS